MCSGPTRMRLCVTVIASGIVVALAIVSLYLCSSMQRSQRWLGATRAVRLHSAIGLRISRLLSERAVLLVGDSRIESLRWPLHGYEGWRATNVGIGGTTAAMWSDWLAGSPSTTPYEAAVLWVGVNDLLTRGADVSATEDKVVGAARGLLSYARRVYVLEQIPVRFASKRLISEKISDDVRQLNVGVAHKLSQEKAVSIMQLEEALRAPDGLLCDWASGDGLHLNERGQAWLSERLAKLLY